jgi:hypothetical protein
VSERESESECERDGRERTENTNEKLIVCPRNSEERYM